MNGAAIILGWSLAFLAIPAAIAVAARGTDEQAIVSGERAWGRAYVTGDAASVERLLADDFRGVDPHGAVYDKATVRRDVRQSPHSTSDEVGPVTVRFYGNTAIAQAHEHEVGPPPARLVGEHVFTDTWVMIGGRWRIVAAEDVAISPVK